MSETRPSKADRFLRRWPKIVGVLLLLVATIGSYSVFQKHRFIQRIEALGGRIETNPGWIRKNIPYVQRVRPKWPNYYDPLRSLESIQSVALFSSPDFAERDWVALSRLNRLESLAFIGMKLTDANLVHLQNLSNLKTLTIMGNTEITDAGLVHLSELSQLEDLHLERTKLTDEGLIHLEEIKTLKRLFLIDDSISNKGLRRLQSALPNCTISY